MKDFSPENNLLPHIIDYYAQEDPDRVYAEYPRSPNTYDDGFTQVTNHSFANVINGIAWWLTNNLGPGNGETLAYIGTNDIRYPALVIGAIKAGYRIFLVSPRNSMPAYKSLFESTKCTRILTQSPRLPPVITIIDGLSMQAIAIPGVDELLSVEHPHFEYSKTYPEHRNDTMAIVHTSGSTGIPKPIIWPLEVANQHIRMSSLQPPSGSSTLAEMFIGSKMFLTLPPFHAAGIGIMIFLAVPSKLTFVVPISASLPTATSFLEAAKHTDLKSAVLPPFILNDLAHSEEMLEFCSQHLELILYGGGDLPQPIGEKIAKKIRLANMYGASEFGIVNVLFSHSNRDHTTDWKYISPHPNLGGEFRHVMDDKYELVLVRSEEREKHQMPFSIFPELTEYPTRDLFMRHPDPTKSDLWRWCARRDDVIVFLNGEKTNPVSMEQHITASNKNVIGVLVAGAQRFQASLIVEYGDKALDPSERAKIIEELWSSIQEANAVCPTHAQISRSHILFTVPEKPMSRAGKGTIQRTATLALYESELEALYADADSLVAVPSGLDVFFRDNVGHNVHRIADSIRSLLRSLFGWHEDQLSDTTNFFHLGFDSLMTMTAARCFASGFRLSNFTPNLIYLNPTVITLAEATSQLMQNNERSEELANAERLRERQALLKKMINLIEPKTNPKAPQLQTVLLTGSTGTLGAYLLDALLKDPAVSHVHCLNRREDSQSVQQEKSTFYNLNSSFDSDRVSFWQVDLSRNNLGLDTGTFTKLQNTVTTFVHNAWNVNFNLSLASFEPDLLGVVNLINFAASSKNAPNLFFISSVGSVLGDPGATPEALVTTAHPSVNGYGNSKYIAEHMISHAAKQRTMRASIARVGQIAGAANEPGLWNKNEWFPSLVMSSQQVNAIPKDLGALGRIDWVPIDLLADVLVDLALNEPSTPGSVEFFHPLNVNPTTWEEIAPIVSGVLVDLALNESSDPGSEEFSYPSKVLPMTCGNFDPIVPEPQNLPSGESFETIPLSDWIKRVRMNMEAACRGDGASDEMLRKNLEKNPAAKLLDFFEALVLTRWPIALDNSNTALKSHKLRTIDGIKEEWIRKWIREWMV
ncbi:NRPS-like enzyme [Penicillium waksmanii]|uniref:NRPS-like enzyme n=1 Tax=Penicillium waksmanii TaxID=69791 RepID=UPI0025477E97|nr:NRPS-like enzyme [Penicillium waksmanii]KAJ5999789.1 NRPS-like enzyme [Penicillium waksmanii]